MSYHFQPGRQYIMPTHFGPMSGPRHAADGGVFPQPDARDIEIIDVAFRTDARALSDLLPPSFEIHGPPVVSIAAIYMSNIAWLAGGGYNALGVTVWSRYTGARDVGVGPLQLVLWEDLPDAILTGREQLGFSKIFCDLPPLQREAGALESRATWRGHQFFDLRVTNLSDAAGAVRILPDIPPSASAGILNLRYVPDIDDSTRALIVQTTLTPFLPQTPNIVKERLTGEATFSFRETTWNNMPTQFRIVEAFRALPVLEMLPAFVVRGTGACDARNQRLLT